MASDERIHLPRGRLLSYLDEGERGATPVLFFHGSPGSRLGAVTWVDRVTAHGGRVIAPDRPGLGRSEPDLGRSLAGWAGDVADLANILGIARFRILAYSGGGPYALATAWALPDRVERVALIGSAGSFDIPGAMDGMDRSNRLLWLTAHWSPRLLRLMLARRLGGAGRDPDGFTDRVMRALHGADREAFAAVAPHERQRFTAELAEAMLPGPAGAVEDMRIVRAPWGFGVQDVHVPVRLWHGHQDRAMPLAMGGWLAAMLPDCTANFMPDEGHISTILKYTPEALDWLLAD